MAKKYDFSPVTSEQQLYQAFGYINERVQALGEQILGEVLPIDTLTVFAHTIDERDFIAQTITKLGPISKFTHSETLYIEPSSAFSVGDNNIKYLGVRNAGNERPELGYGDFPIKDFKSLLARIPSTDGLSLITSGQGKSLIEFRQPNFDVLGFAVNAADH